MRKLSQNWSGEERAAPSVRLIPPPRCFRMLTRVKGKSALPAVLFFPPPDLLPPYGRSSTTLSDFQCL